jgi:hypothetical protein
MLLFYFIIFPLQITKPTSVRVLTDFFGFLRCRSKILSMFQKAVVTAVCDTSGKRVKCEVLLQFPVVFRIPVIDHYLIEYKNIFFREMFLDLETPVN